MLPRLHPLAFVTPPFSASTFSGFGLLLARAPPFGANTCRGSSSWASRGSQDDQTTPNVHFWAANLQTRTVQPKFHENDSERRKTNEHVCERRINGRNLCLHFSAPHFVWAPLVWVWGRHSFGSSLSLRGSHSKKRWCFNHSELSRVSAGTMGIAPQCMRHMHDASSNAILNVDF